MIAALDLTPGALFPRYGAVLRLSAASVDVGGETELFTRVIQPQERLNLQPRAIKVAGLSWTDLESGVTESDAFEALEAWLDERDVDRVVVLDLEAQQWLREFCWRAGPNAHVGLPKAVSVDQIESTLKLLGLEVESFAPNHQADRVGFVRDLAVWAARLRAALGEAPAAKRVLATQEGR